MLRELYGQLQSAEDSAGSGGCKGNNILASSESPDYADKTGDEPMTLCIAAECTDGAKDPAIVLCRDWQAQKGTTTSDDAYKQRDVGKQCRVLIAGSPTRADHLLIACEPAIKVFEEKATKEDTDIDTDKLIQDLRAVTKSVRREYVNNWVAATLNMDFEDFLCVGRTQFHESHYHDIWETIKRYDLGAELLITTFDAEGDPVIIRTDGLGEVHFESDYSIIGSGGEIARAFLCQLDYDPWKFSVPQCIYEVMRAKFAAEHSREVGNDTTIIVTSKGKKDRWLNREGHAFFGKMLHPYKTPIIKFKEDFLELDDAVSSTHEAQNTKPADAGNERASGPSAGGSEGGDSAPSSGIPGGGEEQV